MTDTYFVRALLASCCLSIVLNNSKNYLLRKLKAELDLTLPDMEQWKKNFIQLKELDTPCFSLKQLELFVEVSTNEKSTETPFQKMRRRAITFMEKGYSPIWQFEILVSKDKKDISDGIASIPIIFDTSYIFTLLPDSFNPFILETYHNATKIEANKVTGNFNFIIQRGESLCPDDLDSTGVTLMALMMTGKLRKEKCREMAEQMLATCHKNDKGIYGLYFPVSPHYMKKMTILHLQSFDKSHVDIGILLNFLTFLARLDMDSRDELKPTFDALDIAVDQLMDIKDDGVLGDNCKFYTNPFVLMAFFSRFLENASRENKQRFEGKLKKVVCKRIKTVTEKYQTPLNLACLIIAAVNLRLWKEDEYIRESILEFCRKILKQQDEVDGSFPAWYFYQWKGAMFFGSKYVTTAFVLKALDLVKEKICEDVMAKLF